MSDQNQALAFGAQLATLDAARNWLRRDGRVAVATVIDTWGSAPVPVGGQMAIAADGEFAGSVSGGCIEADVIAEAEAVLETGSPRLMEIGVADETAWQAGLPCGGRIRVLVERLDAADGGPALLDGLIGAGGRREPALVRTMLDGSSRSLHLKGTSGNEAEIELRLRSGKSGVVRTASGEAFLHAMVPPARIIVVGATHIGQIVCQLAALSGYTVTVVDPRTSFASDARFPGVTLKAEWPQDAIPALGLDAYTALVVVAHVSHIDDEALKLALRSPCLYIGALGSKRNHAKRTERLEAAGFTAEEIARIKCPIGLDIGAQTPAEIALSIMAEVVLAVRGPRVWTKTAQSAKA